ncbi:cation transporter [Azonexus sp. IMCC34839]|uniref:cation transporter n=1 Tax=Azonexus sp. IMCC34839 TaxID=3133695 RepID=UPI00399BCF4C
MIRLRLADLAYARPQFDFPGRRLLLDHSDSAEAVLQRLAPLGFAAQLLETTPFSDSHPSGGQGDAAEASMLWLLLAINGLMFGIELFAGRWASSAGLIADAMDMFADAAVYGLALYAVGRSGAWKLRAAHLSGWLQLSLALWVLFETGQRAVSGRLPEGGTMMGISVLALVANAACLWLIARHREGAVHMRASYIFTANDVLANLGVIVAGLLVSLFRHPWPDWVVGGIIGAMVLSGVIRILRLR